MAKTDSTKSKNAAKQDAVAAETESTSNVEPPYSGGDEAGSADQIGSADLAPPSPEPEPAQEEVVETSVETTAENRDVIGIMCYLNAPTTYTLADHTQVTLQGHRKGKLNAVTTEQFYLLIENEVFKLHAKNEFVKPQAI